MILQNKIECSIQLGQKSLKFNLIILQNHSHLSHWELLLLEMTFFSLNVQFDYSKDKLGMNKLTF